MDSKLAKRQFEEFVDQTGDNRRLCERDRDYIDHKQWTPREVQILKQRNQSPVVVNKLKKKHNFLLGLEIRGRLDPKAYPRTPDHEPDADAITDALRYVQDNASLNKTFTECFDEYAVEGHEAVIVEVSGPKREIKPRRIPWDRFYYDPHSRERDFSDAKYLGITAWIDRDDLARMFPDKKNEISQMGDTPSLEDSFQDRPLWFDRASTKRTRVRFNEHYYLEGGEWKLMFFAGEVELAEPQDSPLLDCDGVPSCPIEAESAYIDRENNRYGVTRGDISIQEEINKRRTKALHMLSSQVVVSKKGAVDSGTKMMRDLKSGDAHIELNETEGFDIDRNQELSAGQLALYQDAKSEMDDSVVNAINPEGGESGRSKLVDRENDIDELATVFEGHRDFKLRVYRQIWARVKQFWTDERWVRVTDDEQNVKFVGLNRKITGRDVVAQRFGIQVGDVDQALLQGGISLLPGQLDRVVGVENSVSEIDVDIILNEAPDVVTIQQEQFEVVARLAEVYGPQEVPFEEVIKLSSLRNKEEFLERTKGNEEQQQAAQEEAQTLQQQQVELALQEQGAEVAQKVASAREKNARADQINTETELAAAGVERIG